MYKKRRIIALIMAAGSGTRLGSEMPKQFLDIGGEPMISRSVRVFDKCRYVDDIWAVCASEYLVQTDELLSVFAKYRGHFAGADIRQESVRRGLAGVSASLADSADARTEGDGFCVFLEQGTSSMEYTEPSLCVPPKGDDGSGSIVLIHDAARPFVTQDVVERVIAGAAQTGAAIACVPVTDTIYRAGSAERCDERVSMASVTEKCDEQVFMEDSPNRDTLWSVQTPQGFDLRMIAQAHEAAAADGFEATDDGAVARKYGYRTEGDGSCVPTGADVLIVMGSYANRKITMPEDFHVAGGGVGERADDNVDDRADDCIDGRAENHADDRVGIGFDVHAFVDVPQLAGQDMHGENSGASINASLEGNVDVGEDGVIVSGDIDVGESRALVLGGVQIPYARTLEGHSDADVLTHAIMDAMLGALALGDIGKHFPDTDESYRGISSMKLLAKVMELVRGEGYTPYNIDAVIIAERPRMAEHTDEIKDSISAATGISRDKIGIKATTTEGLGFTGREEGIGAQAVVRLVRRK